VDIGVEEERHMRATDALRRYLPEQVRAALRYYYTQSRLMGESISDAVRRTPANGIDLPPARLRYRVHGAMDARSFLKVGKQCADDIRRSLRYLSRDLSSFTEALDFGCGCGRILRYYDLCSGLRFYGTDIDPEAIRWCRVSLPGAQFAVNSISPPLPFSDAKFDFIYGISVLTHLDEGHQLAWLQELRRVAQPGAVLLLTVHGNLALSGLSAGEIEMAQERGFFFKTFRTGKYKLDGLPDFYQSAVHTKEYVYRVWSKYFTVSGYLPREMNGHQDVVLLERKGR
jgi:SAM-dependent methyltransferase